MKKLITMAFVSASLLISANALANTAQVDAIVDAVVQKSVGTLALDWKVGDTADYSLDMGFLKGTMRSFVREEVPEGIWVNQEMSIMGQKQLVEILHDKNTGEPLEIIQNGKKVDPPSAGDQELVEMKEANITVPAGNFDCIHATIKDKKSGDLTDAWINPELIPMSGMIKTIAPSQMGKVTVELTGFNKQ